MISARPGVPRSSVADGTSRGDCSDETVMARALPNPIPALAALAEFVLVMVVYSSRSATTGSTRVARRAGM